MRFLFIHRHFPGQFEFLVQDLLSNGAHEIVAICEEYRPHSSRLVGVQVVRYTHRNQDPPWMGSAKTQDDFSRGFAVAKVADFMKTHGYQPDMIIAHQGWGESAFLKDVFPETPLLGYCEFYYHGRGVDADFDPEFPLLPWDTSRIRMANAAQLVALAAMDHGVTPTLWQRGLYPDVYQSRIAVIHEGIDLDLTEQHLDLQFQLPDGRWLSPQDEIVTYVARSLEPYRGFHSMVRAIEILLDRRPRCQVVIVGDDGVSYGRSSEGQSHRERFLREHPLDPARVHFVGVIPYLRLLALLKISSAHLYLTVPFVLSWSLLEAMALECAIVASRTAPVEEVLDDESAVLVDFFDGVGISDALEAVLTESGMGKRIGGMARKRIERDYDRRVSIQRYRSLIEEMTGARIL